MLAMIFANYRRAEAISWVPIPCVTTSAGSPVSASGSFYLLRDRDRHGMCHPHGNDLRAVDRSGALRVLQRFKQYELHHDRGGIIGAVYRNGRNVHANICCDVALRAILMTKPLRFIVIGIAVLVAVLFMSFPSRVKSHRRSFD